MIASVAPAQSLPDVNYDQLAAAARFVITTRTAAIDRVRKHLHITGFAVERCLRHLECGWGVIGRVTPSADRHPLIHPKHVAMVTDLITKCRGVPPELHPFKSLAMPPLSAQHHHIVWLVSRGLSNPEIAARMHISEQTVKTHLHRSIFKAFGVQSRPELVYRAMCAGLFGDIPRAPGGVHD